MMILVLSVAGVMLVILNHSEARVCCRDAGTLDWPGEFLEELGSAGNEPSVTFGTCVCLNWWKNGSR